jgi:hypothetical protein
VCSSDLFNRFMRVEVVARIHDQISVRDHLAKVDFQNPTAGLWGQVHAPRHTEDFMTGTYAQSWLTSEYL